jgi:hypothetical protein
MKACNTCFRYGLEILRNGSPMLPPSRSCTSQPTSPVLVTPRRNSETAASAASAYPSNAPQPIEIRNSHVELSTPNRVGSDARPTAIPGTQTSAHRDVLVRVDCRTSGQKTAPLPLLVDGKLNPQLRFGNLFERILDEKAGPEVVFDYAKRVCEEWFAENDQKDTGIYPRYAAAETYRKLENEGYVFECPNQSELLAKAGDRFRETREDHMWEAVQIVVNRVNAGMTDGMLNRQGAYEQIKVDIRKAILDSANDVMMRLARDEGQKVVSCRQEEPSPYIESHLAA